MVLVAKKVIELDQVGMIEEGLDFYLSGYLFYGFFCLFWIAGDDISLVYDF